MRINRIVGATLAMTLLFGTAACSSDSSSSASSDSTVSSVVETQQKISAIVHSGDAWDEAEDRLREAGYTSSDYELKTDDGKSVWLRSNWTVEKVEDGDKPVISLKHNTDEDEEEKKEEQKTAETPEPAQEEDVAVVEEQQAAEPEPVVEEEAVSEPEPVVQEAPAQTQVQEEPQQTSVYYKNCTAARAAGAAPIYKGEPGYRPALDRDRDGVACE